MRHPLAFRDFSLADCVNIIAHVPRTRKPAGPIPVFGPELHLLLTLTSAEKRSEKPGKQAQKAQDVADMAVKGTQHLVKQKNFQKGIDKGLWVCYNITCRRERAGHRETRAASES